MRVNINKNLSSLLEHVQRTLLKEHYNNVKSTEEKLNCMTCVDIRELILTAIPFVLCKRTVNLSVAHVLLHHTLVVPTVDHTGTTIFRAVQFVRLILAVDVTVTSPILWDAPL